MKPMKIAGGLALLAALAAATGARAADESTSSVAFSDPTKPGTLRVRVFHGDVTIHGGDVKQVTVKADAQSSDKPTPRKDGLRVLTEDSTFSLSEKNNVVTLAYGGEDWNSGSSDFDITVPASTSVIVTNSVHGDIDCSGVTGDIDVRTTHGDVTLRDVASGALVETIKGDVSATIRNGGSAKPLLFSSMSGDVVIHAPADLKANVRFRTHRGTILTNFDDKSLVTKTEVSHRSRPAPEAPKSPDAKVPDTPDAKAPAAPDGHGPQTSADGDDSDEQWRQDLKNSIRDAAREIASAAHDAAEAAKEGIREAQIEISTSMDKLPPLPPMTGGKTVSGTLNGGGVELQVSTLNGDITLKKED